jgi:hypothetical protein
VGIIYYSSWVYVFYRGEQMKNTVALLKRQIEELKCIISQRENTLAYKDDFIKSLKEQLLTSEAKVDLLSDIIKDSLTGR